MPSPFFDAASYALKFSDLKQRGELARGQLDVERERNKISARRNEKEYGPQGLAERRLNIAERTNQIREQELPIPEHNFGRDKVTMFEGALQQAGLDKAFSPLLDSMKSLADNPKYNNREVFEHYKANWPAYRKALLDNLQKEAVKSVAENPAKANQIIEIMKQIEEDQAGAIIDQAMPGTATAVINEQALLQSKQKGPKLYETTEGYLPAGQAIGKLKPKRGTRITTSPTGETTVEFGAGIGQGMQRKTTSDIESKLFNAQENVARLEEIAKSYKPEFLELGTKLDTLNTKWQEIGKGTPIEKGLSTLFGKSKPEDRQRLEQFSAFKRDAINNINIYIKEITGAQMSEKEAVRIRKGMPDPGEGLFDGDSPTEFESKWNSAIYSLRMAQARYIQLLRRGFNDTEIQKMAKSDAMPSLANIRQQINTRGNELKKSGLSHTQIKAQLQREFFSIQ